MDKKEFWDRYDLLNKDFLKNYDELENLFVQQLHEGGLDFFELSQIFLLGKFESTLPAFCALCEKNIQNLNEYVLIKLLFSYVHLNDHKSATHIRQILIDKGYDERRPGVLNGIDDFQPSTNGFDGKHITAKYDKRLGEFGEYFLSDLDKVEKFITQKWETVLPNRIFIKVINGVGPSPFNSLLNEIFYKIGHFHKSKFTLDHFSGGIVHEINHFVENNYLTFSIKKADVSSYKFIDEGYAEWTRTLYLKKHKEYKIYTDNCAYHMLGSNLFELSNLKNKWFTVMFDFLNCPILETATSFTYFLEDTFGYDEINRFWESIPNYPEIKTWTDYLKSYLGKDLIDLMKEWKNVILKNKGSRESTSEEIITHFELEQIGKDKMIFHYKSKYPLWAGHNIFIYDDKMKLQLIDKVEKYRFLKEGRLIMKLVKSEKLTVFVHFYQYSQKYEYKLL